ncbi:hypothetical protein Pelo_3151 [Pelomyxa schiedti]|nr:hypothetical protein Pelo_3151 [Pelomyxa schiedti]
MKTSTEFKVLPLVQGVWGLNCEGCGSISKFALGTQGLLQVKALTLILEPYDLQKWMPDSEKTITGTTVYCDPDCLCDSSSFLGGRGERILLIGTTQIKFRHLKLSLFWQEVMEEVAFHINLSKESTKNKPTQQQISLVSEWPVLIIAALVFALLDYCPHTEYGKYGANISLEDRYACISCKQNNKHPPAPVFLYS